MGLLGQTGRTLERVVRALGAMGGFGCLLICLIFTYLRGMLLKIFNFPMIWIEAWYPVFLN